MNINLRHWAYFCYIEAYVIIVCQYVPKLDVLHKMRQYGLPCVSYYVFLICYHETWTGYIFWRNALNLTRKTFSVPILGSLGNDLTVKLGLSERSKQGCHCILIFFLYLLSWNIDWIHFLKKYSKLYWEDVFSTYFR